MARPFEMSAKLKVKISLSELNYTVIILHSMHVNNQHSSYDLIIGRGLHSNLGIILKFQNLTITWENTVCGMKPFDCTHDTHYHIDDPQAAQQDSKRLNKILDAKYEKAEYKKSEKSITKCIT